MSIPRLVSLNFTRGLEKVQILYKQGQLKRANGKMAKIEAYQTKHLEKNPEQTEKKPKENRRLKLQMENTFRKNKYS